MVSPKPAVVTIPALPILPSINELVISVVAWTIGAVISEGCTPALFSSWRTPERTPSSGAAGVVSVLSTITCPSAALISTTSVNVPPMSTASRQSGAAAASAISEVLSRWGEHIQDPDLVHLVVPDEDAVAVPHGTRREIHLAGAELDARLILRFADAEVELAAYDDAELLLVDVMVQERSRGTTGDAPEAELQEITGDDAPPKPLTIGRVERGVVVEVAVLVGEVHRRLFHYNSWSIMRRSTSSRWD